MSGFPPTIRNDITNTSQVNAGRAVSSSQTWVPLADSANWLNGTGAMVIPGLAVTEDITGTKSLFFRYVSRAQAIGRLWNITLVSDTDGATGKFEVGSYSTGDRSISVHSTTMTSMTLYEPFSTQGINDQQIEAKVTFNGGVTGRILSISCFEMWRPILAESFPENGVSLPSVGPRTRIYTGSASAPKSVTQVYQSMINADARRVGFWHMALASPFTTSSGTPVQISQLSMPALARKIFRSDTVNDIYFSAYCKVSGGTGEIKISESSHSNVTLVHFTNTSFAWTTPATISIDAEDLTEPDGLPGGTFDYLTPFGSVTGSNTLTVYSISFWEGPPGGWPLATYIVSDTGAYLVTETGAEIIAG